MWFNGTLHMMARFLPGGRSLRPFLHRLRGVKITGTVFIGDDVYLEEDYPECVEIHDGAVISARCTIIAQTRGPGKIVIGKQTAIAAGCLIVCATGQTLTIGEGAVISAGSTVSHDIPPHTLCGPPRIKAFAKVTVPFTFETTYEEFRRGLEPIRAKNGEGEHS
jgi:serine acetyltransferase